MARLAADQVFDAVLIRCRRFTCAFGAASLHGHLGSIVAMVPGESGVEQTPVAAAGLDPDSVEWLRVLADAGPSREAALARLHEMLLRIARGEVRRRGPRLRLTGPELDDLAYQAAADALIAITSKVGQFRGGEPVHDLGI